MQDSNTTADKSIVEELTFGAKMAQRVGWEAFEFSAAALSVSASDGVETGADKLQTDGGMMADAGDSDSCENGDDRCDGPDGVGFPCFDCFEMTEGQ